MKFRLQLALKQPEFMRTCLPMSEYFLKDSDNQNALKIIARNKNIDKYRGLLDFAVVEMMPRLLKPLCIKFYADESFGNMVDHFHPVDNKRMDRILLESLKFAKSIHDQERILSWSGYKVELIDNLVLDDKYMDWELSYYDGIEGYDPYAIHGGLGYTPIALLSSQDLLAA
mgnify:FL=1|jgi:hypothetical protein